MASGAVQRRSSLIFVLTLVARLALLTGCGAVSNAPISTVMVTPAQANVRAGDTQQFTAQVNIMSKPASGASSTTTMSNQVAWAVNGIAGGNSTVGTINSSGLYTAPASLPDPTSVKITATAAADATLSGDSEISLENPVPVVGAVSPDPVTVGSIGITVNGSKFVQGSQVFYNGTLLTTHYVSANRLTATGTAAQGDVGTIKLTVKNPDPGAAESAAYNLKVQTPLAIGVKVSPATAQVRPSATQQFSATLTGTGNTQVTWSVSGVAGGNATVGTISTSGLYTAPAKPPTPNPVKVTATSVADTRASGSSTTTLLNPVPTVTSVSPQSVNIGNFSITVTGTNFVNGATVVFGGTFLTTTYVSATQLTAAGTATAQQVGTVQVAVLNPDPGSVDSNAVAMQVSGANAQVTAAVAARFLEQSSWGPTPATIAQVQAQGLQNYLSQQFTAPVSTYPAPAATDDISVVQKRFFVNAVTGQDQLRQRIAFALSQIMVISAGKIGDPSAFTQWNNMLANDAFGNFSTVLKDVTLSPAMGYYLDMANNDGCNGCNPNENYAREILQLFSIGLVQLNPDGTPQLDGSGLPLPTYTQDTIIGFGHVFTGWTFPAAPGKTAQFYDSPYFGGPMIAFDTHHDKGAKLLLSGVTLPAGGTAQGDLDAGIQNILSHPNVGPFISSQLIQKLVTSNPSPDYVSRITQVFNDNGSGVRGDLKAVVTAILMDPEARRGDDPAQVGANDGHLKEPLLFMMNLLRATNATTDGANLMYYGSNMKQEPFNSPTVFNFYPPNYQVPGTQLLGPEFKIFNSTTAIYRINFVNDLIYGSVSSTTKTNISSYVSAAADVNTLLDMVSANLMHGQMSDAVRSTLATTLTGITDPTRRAKAALYLVGSSSQYQVEH